MKITVNPINKALIAVAYMSRFNWFDIATEHATTGETSSFCATGIAIRESGTLQFERQFATPKISDGRMEEIIPVNESKFLFLDEGGTVYTIECRNKAFADCSTASGSKDDPSTLIDWSRSDIDTAGNMLVVLDLRKLGVISNVEYSRIKNYMDIYLGGLSIKNQVCRTIYIEVASNQQITVGLFNLEQEQKMTAVFVNLETSYTEDEAEKLKRLLEVAREELEVIPLF